MATSCFLVNNLPDKKTRLSFLRVTTKTNFLSVKSLNTKFKTTGLVYMKFQTF